ncbi:hypothetical protein Pmani_030803 [Petrolisthes manimaculis]|uniref:Ionotropic glutamate receptor C-terminal domain-containing protein n=1 Tax=Petrolisthes manimaculis TaxID=1843537 RepID=A0AAE1NX69_9EUCA|nr:hypothetical protein Pmani_030803 [Petrolisthes manimaculis]
MAALVKTLLLHWFLLLWPQPAAERNCVDVKSDVVGQGQGEVGVTVGETVSDDGIQQRVEGDVGEVEGRVKGELEGQQRVEGDVGEVEGRVKGELEGQQRVEGDVGEVAGRVKGELEGQQRVEGDVGEVAGRVKGELEGQQLVEGDVGEVEGRVKGELEGQQRVEGDVGEVAGMVKGELGEIEGQGMRGDMSELEGQKVVVVQHGVNERQGSEAEKQGVDRSKIRVVLDDEAMAEQQRLGQVISEVVEQQHLSHCDLVLLDSSPRSTFVSALSRRVRRGVTVISWTGSEHHHGHLQPLMEARGDNQQQYLPPPVWGDTRTTCRVLILPITNITHANTSLWVAERAGLWKLAHTRVVMVGVGGYRGSECILLHPTLRNTIHALVLELKVYRRSLYLRNGEAGVQHVLTTYLSSNNNNNDNINNTQYIQLLLNSTLFFNDKDQFLNFEGHKLRVVTAMYFPYVAYRKLGDEPNSPVLLTDSLDARLYHTLSPALNFTYEVHEEPNRSWGTETNGVFSGMMGQLQREECDLCTMASLNPSRQANFHLAQAYPADDLVLVSRKPDLLPPYLSIVRPFSGVVWVSLLMGVVLFGVSFWALLRALRLCVVGGREVSLVTSLLYGWGTLLERPPPHPTSVTVTGRMMMACWLVVCLVVTSAFRSSLVAHLTVQGREAPLDTLEDLVTRPGWGWGMESWTLTGAIKELSTNNRDPVFSYTFQKMETGTWEEFLEKVVRRRFSLLTVRNHITVIVASHYTNQQGQTPVYISPTSVYHFPSFGWILRKGAPFYNRFQTILTSLVESGIMQVWKEDVIAKRVKETKDSDTFKLHISQDTTMQGNNRVVLGLHHLQGAFYLLFLGCGLAFLTLLGEKLVSHTSSVNKSFPSLFSHFTNQ